MGNEIRVEVDRDLARIVPGYLERRRSDLALLRNALVKRDFEYLTTAGHQLKGSAGSYGFDLLGVLGETMELGAKEKNVPKIQTVLEEIENYLNKLEVVFVDSAA